MGASRLIFVALLSAGWLLLAAITILALAERGLVDALLTFVRDLGHPWRAQYLTDFSLHVLLVAGWIFWRAQSAGRGAALALAAVLLGSLFTLPYLIVLLAATRGDLRQLLLGRHG